jgi:hypothetical protein
MSGPSHVVGPDRTNESCSVNLCRENSLLTAFDASLRSAGDMAARPN